MALYVVLFILAVVPLAAQPSAEQQDGPALFEKSVRPLLAAQCLGCHSATSQPIMGGRRALRRRPVFHALKDVRHAHVPIVAER